MTGAMVGAAWGACAGAPAATGAPITAGAAMVVPHGEPRWSQFRNLPQWQPAVAVVKTAKANRIANFLVIIKTPRRVPRRRGRFGRDRFSGRGALVGGWEGLSVACVW